MPLYDLTRGGARVDSARLFKKYVEPISDHIDARTFEVMKRTIDTALQNLHPSMSSQLVWTRLAALIGYNSMEPTKSVNHLWEKAFEAVSSNPDKCNIFVGSLVMWRVSLLTADIWLTDKSQDRGKHYEFRAYWINNNFKPNCDYSLNDLKSKFNS